MGKMGSAPRSYSKIEVPKGQYGEIDNFYVIKTIGKGGFGKVKVGFKKDTYEKVAIKFCTRADPKSQGLFRQEAEVMAMVNRSDNVIKVYAHGESVYVSKKGNQK